MRNVTPFKLAVLTIGLTSVAHAQVTVFDAPNEVHFAATVETLKSQLEQVRALTASISGLREFNTELKTLSVSTVLPTNLLALYGFMSSSRSFRASAPCVARDASSEALCQLDAAKTSADQQLASALYSQAPTRQLELNALETALLGAPDLKTSADLSTRTGLANASLENQRLQVELFQLQSTLQDQSIAKARRWDQLTRVTTSARAIDSLAPMTFGVPSIRTRTLMVHVAICISACTSATDRPTPRPDDQPKVPVNRSGATARPESIINQHPTMASS